MAKTITEITRRAIFDHLTAEQIDWVGRLGDDEFLSRLYDLTSMESEDHRFPNAAADIHQHRMNWHDWPDDWVSMIGAST